MVRARASRFSGSAAAITASSASIRSYRSVCSCWAMWVSADRSVVGRGHSRPAHLIRFQSHGGHLAPSEQPLDIREFELDIGRPAVIALPRVGGLLHLA